MGSVERRRRYSSGITIPVPGGRRAYCLEAIRSLSARHIAPFHRRFPAATENREHQQPDSELLVRPALFITHQSRPGNSQFFDSRFAGARQNPLPPLAHTTIIPTNHTSVEGGVERWFLRGNSWLGECGYLPSGGRVSQRREYLPRMPEDIRNTGGYLSRGLWENDPPRVFARRARHPGHSP